MEVSFMALGGKKMTNRTKKELREILNRISKGEDLDRILDEEGIHLSDWELNDLASLLIRSKGCTWAGRDKARLDIPQLKFEEKWSKVPKVPFRGRSYCG